MSAFKAEAYLLSVFPGLDPTGSRWRIQPRDQGTRELNLSGLAASIIWFREDLRLADNPALADAASGGAPICVFIREEGINEARPLGGAAKWWLDKSLRALDAEIARRGGRLLLRTGEPAEVLLRLARETGARRVVWNRRYGAAERRHDEGVKKALKADGIEAVSFNARLLIEPWELKTASGGHYRVFTPFWRALRAAYTPSPALPAPARLAAPEVASEPLDSWALHPSRPDWSAGLAASWTPGETGAQARLDGFLKQGLDAYAEQRNRPDIVGSTSGLSPHLRFGEIGPAQIWRAVMARFASGGDLPKSAEVFLSEIAWREFSYVLLWARPDLAAANYNPAFDRMPWRRSPRDLAAWQRGRTGYPIVDAGMRQLWTTGWMHNRVRMIVASFLTKHLLLAWQAGEDWFWDTLVDADPASNAASWQWTAGSGADAAPYFRVFNPITQGQKFDETGGYVRRWCPELAGLPDKFLHAPFDAPRDLLARAGVILGKTYPEPIISHTDGRTRALDAYRTLKDTEAA